MKKTPDWDRRQSFEYAMGGSYLKQPVKSKGRRNGRQASLAKQDDKPLNNYMNQDPDDDGIPPW